MKLALLSNVNMDSLIKSLKSNYEIYQPSGYNVWIQELLNPLSSLAAFKPQVAFLLLDGHELFQDLGDDTLTAAKAEEYLTYIEKTIREYPSVTYFVSNLDFYPYGIRSVKDSGPERRIENYWLSRLEELNSHYPNFFIFDLKYLIENMGRNRFYSDTSWYLGGLRYAMQGERLIKAEIVRCVEAYKGARKKCLVLDLDNTLWGGVIGEDLLQGIQLSPTGEGARFYDFQRKIKELQKLGILLAAVSKNNLQDVLEVFQSHPHMFLQESDFTVMKVNWQPKVQNIEEIAGELNIGLDSMVFIDDNPVERASVRKLLPDVEVPEFPSDTAQLASFMDEIYRNYFYTLKVTAEDEKKTAMYRENAKRLESREKAGSLAEYLISLETKVFIHKIQLDDVERVAQLTQKTNQFNVTTKRYTIADIQEFMRQSDYEVFVVRVKDRFGDYGKVGVVIVAYQENMVVLDSFLLSCRVMERYVEDLIMRYLESYFRQKGYDRLIARYIPTPKNLPVAELFDRLGYMPSQNDQGEKTYVADLHHINEARRSYYGEVVAL